MFSKRNRQSLEKRLLFVFSPEKLNTGTTVMRGRQLSELARTYLPSNYEVGFVSLSAQLKNSILFITKNALQQLGADGLKKLKAGNNSIVIDPVDSALTEELVSYVDTIVAASLSAFNDFRATFPLKTVFLVDHHVDPRLKLLQLPSQSETFRVGYFGMLENAIITPSIEKVIDFIPVDVFAQKEDWFKKLPSYSMHYCLRSESKKNRYKPFLKGFVAAHCGANVIADSAQPEAVRWLGKDYPYLIHGEVNEVSILTMVQKAKESFGSREWVDALKVMEKIRNKTSDREIGRQLRKLVEL